MSDMTKQLLITTVHTENQISDKSVFLISDFTLVAGQPNS